MDKVPRFEDLPEDIQEDFHGAPYEWREKQLRIAGWSEDRILAFLGEPPADSDHK